MRKCKANRCEVSSPSKLNNDGYCNKHKQSKSSPVNTSSPTALDQNALLVERVATLEAENFEIKSALKAALNAIDEIHAHMNMQRTSINTSTYKRDALNQYGRKESARLINAKEAPLQYDNEGKIKDTEDCVQLAIDAAEVLDIKLERSDIQRAHRVGKQKLPSVGTDGKMITPKL